MEYTKQQQLRKLRFTQLQNTIKDAYDAGMPIEYEKFIANLCIEWTASRRAVMEYITCLVTLNILKETKVEDVVYLCWNAKQEEHITKIERSYI